MDLGTCSRKMFLTLSLRRALPRSASSRTERRAESGNIKRAQSLAFGAKTFSQKRLCDITFRNKMIRVHNFSMEVFLIQQYN